MLETSAIVRYDPRRPDSHRKKHKRKWHCIATLDPQIGRYYRSWVARAWGLDLLPPVYGLHVTIVNFKAPATDRRGLWRRHEGERLKIRYSPEIQRKWKFFYLPVTSVDMTRIRQALGLDPAYPFHITIGRLP